MICGSYPASAAPVTAQARDASCAPVTPPRAGDRAGVRREPRAGDAAAPCGPACHGTRLPAAIDGATLLHPYNT